MLHSDCSQGYHAAGRQDTEPPQMSAYQSAAAVRMGPSTIERFLAIALNFDPQQPESTAATGLKVFCGSMQALKGCAEPATCLKGLQG